MSKLPVINLTQEVFLNEFLNKWLFHNEPGRINSDQIAIETVGFSPKMIANLKELDMLSFEQMETLVGGILETLNYFYAELVENATIEPDTRIGVILPSDAVFNFVLAQKVFKFKLEYHDFFFAIRRPNCLIELHP